VFAPQAPPEVRNELAPGGILRAAINLGNPMLANRSSDRHDVEGVSVDLARALAARLGVTLQLVPYESAGQVVAASSRHEWDVAFVAIDPLRGQTLEQSSAYLVIEGAYLVSQDSPIKSNDDVDAEGVRIAVGANSAYDLYLSRSLMHAKLVRVPTSPEVTSAFLREHLEVAAGVKQQLQADAAKTSGLRLLPGRFMRIDQAMAVPQGHRASIEFVEQFVDQMKRSGRIERFLIDHHIEGAQVAP
jgi:polar amino acid transport system substrate-binding protein